MKHQIKYLGNQPGAYEAVLIDLFQQHPPARLEFTITIHEVGEAGGAYSSHQRWEAGAQRTNERAHQAAHTIVAQCGHLTGSTFSSITIDA